MTQSLDFISKKSYKHINNNHKKLKFNQIKDLQEIDDSLDGLLVEIEEVFNSRKFERISYVLSRKQELISLISDKITTRLIEQELKKKVQKTLLYTLTSC